MISMAGLEMMSMFLSAAGADFSCLALPPEKDIAHGIGRKGVGMAATWLAVDDNHSAFSQPLQHAAEIAELGDHVCLEFVSVK